MMSIENLIGAAMLVVAFCAAILAIVLTYSVAISAGCG